MFQDNTAYQESLICRIRLSDESAFEEVYREYAPALVTYAGSKLASLEETRDLIQDVFANLWSNREKLNITTSLRAYLFTAVKYRIIDHIRRNITHEHYVSMMCSLSVQPESSLEKSIEAKDLHRSLQEAVSMLPSRTREIYYLSRNANLKIAAIAKLLNLSDQTVKNQLTTALKHLRAYLLKLTLLLLLI